MSLRVMTPKMINVITQIRTQVMCSLAVCISGLTLWIFTPDHLHANEFHTTFSIDFAQPFQHVDYLNTAANESVLKETHTYAPDRAGLGRDTRYYFLYQIAFIGVLYVMPQDISGWSQEQKDKNRIEAYKENVSRLNWDTDDFAINYIGHPYFGAAYYVRARERGFNTRDSFWYSALLSASFEFGTEAFFESPSIQDLIVTPVLGSALGHYFEGVRYKIKQNQLQTGLLSTGDKWILALTDPLGFVNQYTERLFNRNVQAQITPFILLETDSQITSVIDASNTYGLTMMLNW